VRVCVFVRDVTSSLFQPSLAAIQQCLMQLFDAEARHMMLMTATFLETAAGSFLVQPVAMSANISLKH
jgi:hypothetical protein